MQNKISIIGAGPSGSQLAYLLAKKHSVDVYEEHPTIGKPVQCTGIISKNLKEIIPLNKFVLNKVKGSLFFSKHQCFELKTDKTQAYIVDRTKMDQFLADRAKKQGANFHIDHRFLKLKQGKKIDFELQNKNKIMQKQADKLIGADGPLSQVAKSAGMFGKRTFLTGIQARVKGKFDPELVHLYLGSVCPGFFAWLVPENDRIARVGLAAKARPRDYFQKFMKKFNYKVIDKQAGLIPMYSKVQTQKKNIYLLGDAAMQVKATTGGGVVMGLLAAEALAKSVNTGISYPLLWKKKVAKDLFFCKMIRNKLNGLSDKRYDDLLRIMNKEKTQKTLKEAGDMDFPTKFILKLLIQEPRLLKFLF